MNFDIVIRVENVAKSYAIWSSPSARLHGPILGRIGQMPFLPASAREFCKRISHASFQNFFALRDISLQVKKGECVGIVGRNGSGKSTLLQIIAGTLDPTAGSVSVTGKVAALLELGSGFNPEFTGRDNVRMNCSILGLSRQETEAKFDEIAAFAEIGDFIERPTKTYSSGMVLRLAFAVQAVVNPDLLIVDEALAVGDEAFQRKCFSRIESLRERGGTILFVSHSASTVVELCSHAILLDRGELLMSGKPKLVVANYHRLLYAPANRAESVRQEIRDRAGEHPDSSTVACEITTPNQSVAAAEPPQTEDSEYYDSEMAPKSTVRYVSRGATIQNPHIETIEAKTVNVLVRGRTYVYTYTVTFERPMFKVRFGMLIKTVSGIELGGASTLAPGSVIDFVENGQIAQVDFRFRCLLQPGVYFLNAGVGGIIDDAEGHVDRHLDAAMFRVQPERDTTVTGIVDFLIKPSVSFITMGRPVGAR